MSTSSKPVPVSPLSGSNFNPFATHPFTSYSPPAPSAPVPPRNPAPYHSHNATQPKRSPTGTSPPASKPVFVPYRPEDDAPELSKVLKKRPAGWQLQGPAVPYPNWCFLVGGGGNALGTNIVTNFRFMMPKTCIPLSPASLVTFRPKLSKNGFLNLAKLLVLLHPSDTTTGPRCLGLASANLVPPSAGIPSTDSNYTAVFVGTHSSLYSWGGCVHKSELQTPFKPIARWLFKG
ncbi:hypothetical protein C8R43DRAFT_1172351 [Mycena crocata]|nr:hypothetical protein C8R43DRAFT_1172351 [Mycena crocata]